MSHERATELNESIINAEGVFKPANKSQTLDNLYKVIKSYNEIYWINLKYIPAKA